MDKYVLFQNSLIKSGAKVGKLSRLFTASENEFDEKRWDKKQAMDANCVNPENGAFYKFLVHTAHPCAWLINLIFIYKGLIINSYQFHQP